MVEAMVRVFTPWKLATTANQALISSPEKELVVKYLPLQVAQPHLPLGQNHPFSSYRQTWFSLCTASVSRSNTGSGIKYHWHKMVHDSLGEMSRGITVECRKSLFHMKMAKAQSKTGSFQPTFVGRWDVWDCRSWKGTIAKWSGWQDCDNCESSSSPAGLTLDLWR